jgi:putative SOS response-associated peptidase YedK
MYSWREVHAFSQPLTVESGAGSNDAVLTYTPGRMLPVIVFDHATRERVIIPMRWGFPDPRNPYSLKHIHARADRLEETQFSIPFREGQRGIVSMRTFNEGREVIGPKGGTSTEQWTIDPQDGQPRGFAFLWKEFEIGGQTVPCCIMVTVPASKLIEPVTDRMPAILRDEAEHEDWRIWLGEESAELDEVKSVLQTMENVKWKMEREPKKPKEAKPSKHDKPKQEKPDAEPGLF